MTARAGPNTRAAARALRLLARQDRLDEVAELLGVLLRTSAALVDEATGPSSDMAGYARARVIQAHGQLVQVLHHMVSVSPDAGLSLLLAQIGAGAGDAPEGPDRLGPWP
jgi:hypothetical protein